MTTYTTVLTLFCTVTFIAGTIAGRSNAAPSPAPAPAPPKKGGGGGGGGAGGGGGEESFVVQGRVYCDPCRIQFPTRISYPVPNTKVVLACRERENSAETFTVEGTCDGNGMYSITVNGDHEEEICYVKVTESPDKKCPEVMDDESSSRVSLTDKNGVRGKTRMANPIGFMVKDVDPKCKEILAEIGIMGY